MRDTFSVNILIILSKRRLPRGGTYYNFIIVSIFSIIFLIQFFCTSIPTTSRFALLQICIVQLIIMVLLRVYICFSKKLLNICINKSFYFVIILFSFMFMFMIVIARRQGRHQQRAVLY